MFLRSAGQSVDNGIDGCLIGLVQLNRLLPSGLLLVPQLAGIDGSKGESDDTYNTECRHPGGFIDFEEKIGEGCQISV